MQKRQITVWAAVAIGLLALIATAASAATYYVDTNNGTASDSNSGTAASPWKTIGKANSTLQAGDTVLIKAGNYPTTSANTNTVSPSRTGTSTSPITYQNYGTDVVTITNGGAGAYAVLIDGKSYIVVQGINATDLDYFMYIQNYSTYNTVCYSSFYKPRLTNGQPASWASSRIQGNSQYNWIHHCSFSDNGYFMNCESDSNLDIGTESNVQPPDISSHNLLENNTFYHGGHHVVGILSGNNVIRNNYFHGENWCLGSGDRGVALYGDRCLYLSGNDSSNGQNLVEGNRFGYSGDPATLVGSSGVSVDTPYNIIRKNYVFFNDAWGVTVSLSDGYHFNEINNKIYNNTCFHNGPDPNRTDNAGLFFANWGDTVHIIQNNTAKNNILYQNPLDINQSSYDGTNLLSLQTIVNNWLGNTQGDPLFVNAGTTFGDPMDATYPDLRIRPNSPCVDQGTYLAVITSPSGSGTTFTVDDAGYFMDGWGIPNVQGDQIQLFGTTQQARCTVVNYTTNTITVDQSLTWVQNQGVCLPYAGSAPDLGAYEVQSNDTTPPSAPGVVRDGTGTDISTTAFPGQLSANWDAATDAESGIAGYRYAIGTSAGGTQTLNWTLLGNVTTVTTTGLSLTVGQTYYFSVLAVNGAGLTSNATSSNGQTFVTDPTPPSTPANVRDGTGADISTTCSTTQLSANWDASTDNESGISGYQYAIGTSAGGTQIVNWTWLGNVTTVTNTGLSLVVGQTYYFSVRAVNGSGSTGNAANSNGQTAVNDPTPPSTPPAVRDGTGTDIATTGSTTQLSANWDASTDNESGISGYQYAIGTSAGGTQTVNWTSLGNVTTVTNTGLSLVVGQTYYFSVRAVNGWGLTGNAANSNGQTVIIFTPTVYFQDNFENWTTHGGAWTSVNGESAGHTLNTNTDYAAAGTKSLKITCTDSTTYSTAGTGASGASLSKTFSPNIIGDIYIRFYLFLPTGYGSINSGMTLRILRLYNNSSGYSMLSLGGDQISMQEVGGWSNTPNVTLSENQWHCIEMHVAYQSASTPMQIWVDGASQGTLNGAFSGNTSFSYMQFSQVALSSGIYYHFTICTSYWDEMIVSNFYNGPLDTTGPSPPPAVRDGTGADISTTSSTTQLSANWDASTDAQSGISGYQYAIGTTAGGTQILNWTSLGNVTTVTQTGLSLAIGQTYYFSVVAVNGSGVTGPATNSNGQAVYNPAANQPPNPPANVRDGTGADIVYTTSASQLSANWDASTDPDGSVTAYEYAIGTTAGGSNVVNWTVLGNVTTVTKTGLSLTSGQTYYFSVAAIDNQSLAGNATNSNGQTVDTTAPSAPPSVRDGMGADISTTTSTTQLSANWDASTDAESGISGYQYAIGTSAGGTQVVNWTSLGNVTTVTKTGLTLSVGQTYFFSVQAVNGAGLTGSATNSNGQQPYVAANTTYFSDNFESWTTSIGAWTQLGTSNGGGHTLGTDSGITPELGTTCLKITSTDSTSYSTAGTGANGICLQKTFSPTMGGPLYIRFYLFLPTGYNSSDWWTTGGEQLRLMRTYATSSSGTAGNTTFTLQATSGTSCNLGYQGPSWGGSSPNMAVTENKWHCVEQYLGPLDGASPSNDVCSWWFDGALVYSYDTSTTGQHWGNGATNWSYVQLGDCSIGSGTASRFALHTMYLDEVVTTNFYNGPLPPSPPPAPANVRDGTGADIATTGSTTQLSANWDAVTDANSGISGYQYAIGTTAGGTQTVNWTSLGNVTTVTQTGLTLVVGQTYFFSVQAVNGAGLTGSATNSNGQTVVDMTPPTVTSTVVNGANGAGTQRSMVNSLVVTFSKIATLDPGAFTIVNKATLASVTAAVSADSSSGKTVATLTWSGTQTSSGSLIDGNYQLTIDATKVHDSTTGVNLDGDKDGQPGGNYVFGAATGDNFFRLFGDADGSRRVDNTDFSCFTSTMGKRSTDTGYLWYMDVNSNNRVDNTDFSAFAAQMGKRM